MIWPTLIEIFIIFASPIGHFTMIDNLAFAIFVFFQ